MALLIADADARRMILPRLENEDLAGLLTAAIFTAVIELEQEGTAIDFQSLSERTEDDAIAPQVLPMLLMSETELPEKSEERLLVAERCLDRLKLMRIDRRIEELKVELAEAQRSSDQERLAILSNEQIQLTRLKGALMPKAEAMQPGL